MTPTITNRKLAKVKFFAVYSFSVLLILILLSSFLMPESPSGTASDGQHRAAIIELLHRKLAPLQLAAASVLENGATPGALNNLEKQKTLFMQAVDSIHKETSSISNAEEKAAIESLLQNFALDAEREHRIAKSHVTGSVPATAGTGSAAGAGVDQLKALLVQKEAQIAELEEQKKRAEDEKNAALAAQQQGPAASPNTVPQNLDADAAEWKEKYNKLKAAHEKAAAQLEALKSSYKEVVDDNRRLITQLQAARAAKN